MAIPREALQQTVDAGHPDDALIALPVSLIREMLPFLPLGPANAGHTPVFVSVDLGSKPDMCA